MDRGCDYICSGMLAFLVQLAVAVKFKEKEGQTA